MMRCGRGVECTALMRASRRGGRLTWFAGVLAVLLSGCSLEGGGLSASEVALMTGGDADRGRHHIRAFGCDACHTIPGIAGADRMVGPSLAALGERMYIAGLLANNPDNLVRWIRNPPGIDPMTAMPYLGVTEQEARDIAAYLYSIR